MPTVPPPRPLNRHVDDIRPFRVMEILHQADAMQRAGRSVIHMEVGEPDFPTPEGIAAAASAALQAGQTRYTPAMGLPELRAAIAAHYPAACRPAPERIAITPGSSIALQLLFGLLLNPGDEVLLADPGYPCNANFVRLYGGVPVGVPCDAETAFQLTAEAVVRHWRPQTRVVLVGNPSNPTGTLIAPAELAAIAAAVRERGGVLIVDEIYHGLVYDDAEVASALTLGEDVFVVNGFSKFYGMTGWRLGWLVAPPAYLDAINRLCQNLYIAAPTLAQHAALAAFSPGVQAELERRRQVFQQRRDLLLEALPGLGFTVPVQPQGAFYIYAQIPERGMGSDALAAWMLAQTGVALTPGHDFGEHAAKHHIRFAYTSASAQLTEGVERLRGLLGSG